jgi:hypothetical protein
LVLEDLSVRSALDQGLTQGAGSNLIDWAKKGGQLSGLSAAVREGFSQDPNWCTTAAEKSGPLAMMGKWGGPS